MKSSVRIFAFAFFVPVILATMSVESCQKRGKEPYTPGHDSGHDSTVVANTQATMWTTRANKQNLFAEEKLDFGPTGAESEFTIILDPSEKQQSIVGFGPAMTGASCYNLLQMAPQDRRDILNELFNPETGLGMSLIRVSIGSSDFSVNEDFTWCDKRGMENFGVPKEDREYLFPILHEMYDINPDIKIIASPWTCPLWMKRMSVNDDSDFVQTDPDRSLWASGSLKPSCYQDYAEYFVRWILAMEDEGFDIFAITVQNEPYNAWNTASLYMTWQEQRDFVKSALGPAFRKAGLKTRIICYDHNFDEFRYPLNIYQDADASQYIAGSAWHNYAGDVSALDNVVSAYPDKEIYFTEASIGEWNYGFQGSLIRDFCSIFLETLSRGCKGITLWNLALDENNKPYRHHGCATCYGAITISSTEHKVIDRLSQYYNLAHVSKVIRPDAVKIGTKIQGTPNAKLTYQAYMNADGSYAVIMVNKSVSGEVIGVTFDDGVHSVKCEIPGYSLVSLLWKD